MKQTLAIGALGLLLTGCMTAGDWSEAPYSDHYGYDDGYGTDAPVGWWGSNAASVDLFYGPLSRYGYWDSYPGYGRVFVPSGVGRDWRPYSNGYWANDPRHGRRWVSSEPFGWATYHYGRWGRDNRLGWFWVPDTRFGGSWVDWRRSGGYDSWSPLPPVGWDRYARSGYGYGNDWWLHAPSRYAWQRGGNRYVRPGRHDGRPDRTDTVQPVIPRPPVTSVDRDRRNDPQWRAERQRRAEAWRSGERRPQGEGWRGGERQPRGDGWQGGERPGFRGERPDVRRDRTDEARRARLEAAQARGALGRPEAGQRRPEYQARSPVARVAPPSPQRAEQAVAPPQRVVPTQPRPQRSEAPRGVHPRSGQRGGKERND